MLIYVQQTFTFNTVTYTAGQTYSVSDSVGNVAMQRGQAIRAESPTSHYPINAGANADVATYSTTTLSDGTVVVNGLNGPSGTVYSIAGTYTWAQLQALTGQVAGNRAIVSDLRFGEFIYDGAYWVPYTSAVLSQSALPLIYPPSGSVANNGALTLGTAMSGNWYPKSFMYFPAGAIVAGSLAGWYYTTMSSTTSGVVYNNTYTSGSPKVPNAPVAFITTGPGAYTQTTSTDIPALQYAVQAGLVGPYGGLDCDLQIQCANTAGVKTIKAFMGGLAGSQFATLVLGSTYGTQARTVFRNAGDYAVNWGNVNNNDGLGSATQPLLPTSQNMAVAQTLTHSVNMAAATDTIIIVGHRLELSGG